LHDAHYDKIEGADADKKRRIPENGKQLIQVFIKQPRIGNVTGKNRQRKGKYKRHNPKNGISANFTRLSFNHSRSFPSFLFRVSILL
jgi:hypothetical protein